MAIRRQHNIERVLIAKDVARTASATISTLANGEIGVFSKNGTLVTESTHSPDETYLIAQGRGSGVDPIIFEAKGNEFTGYRGVSAAAQTEQIDYIGYNGTSGDIETVDSNVYQLNVTLDESDSFGFSQQKYKFAVTKSAASALMRDVAWGLTKNFNKNFSREPERDIIAEMVSADAGTPLGTGTATSATVVFTHGSAVVTGWAAVDNATTYAALAVGNYLRVGTAVTSPLYKIASIDATNNTLTLDAPYVGATQTLNDTGLEQITATQVEAAAVGVKLTGRSRTWDSSREPSVVRFTTAIKDMGSLTEITKSQLPSDGTGTYAQVATIEKFAQGNEGPLYPSNPNGPLLREFRTDAVAGTSYDIVTLDLKSKPDGGFTEPVLHKSLVIALPAGFSGTSLTGAASSLLNVLDDICVDDNGVGSVLVGQL